MTRKHETINVTIFRFDGDETRRTVPCRVVGKIGPLAVTWDPIELLPDGTLSVQARIKRDYFTVVLAYPGRQAFALTRNLSRYAAAKLALVLASERIPWGEVTPAARFPADAPLGGADLTVWQWRRFARDMHSYYKLHDAATGAAALGHLRWQAGQPDRYPDAFSRLVLAEKFLEGGAL
jgi:hypothetical protein